MCQDLYKKAKECVRKDACVKFCDLPRPIELVADASSIGLGARLLWVRDSMNCGHDEVSDNVVL